MISSRSRTALPGVALAVTLAWMAGAGCGAGPSSPIAGEEYTSMVADQVLIDVEHHMTGSGLRRAFVVSDTAFVFDNTGMVHLRLPRITIYDETGEQSAFVTAREGDLDTRTEYMVLRGDVLLVTQEANRQIRTAEIHFQPQEDRIWSDSATVMIEGETTIDGSGFSATAGMKNLRVRDSQIRGFRIEF
jgi:LPS export ABC transporter protein LptC